jgi:Fe-Mn family superoxide dismutase
MANELSRRKFLHQSAKTSVAVAVAGLAGGDLLAGCTSAKVISGGAALVGFEQTPLPYGYKDLEPIIDAMTMEIHYSKHAAAYATNLRDAAKAENIDQSKPVETIFSNISAYSAKVRNNGGGHYNHELFWRCMKPNGGGQPTGALLSSIQQSFGSFEAFQTQFTDAG